MMDPPRTESAAAVSDCKRAGICPVMITGDHKVTAAAIAKRIGILDDISQACEGVQIDGMSDEELNEFVENIRVYARVTPEHKIRIVRAWQERGNIVAMTGDGVNDAPALKQADVGVAMGITGTEVAKDAASMILTDDNFATIIKAVESGRKGYTVPSFRKFCGDPGSDCSFSDESSSAFCTSSSSVYQPAYGQSAGHCSGAGTLPS